MASAVRPDAPRPSGAALDGAGLTVPGPGGAPTRAARRVRDLRLFRVCASLQLAIVLLGLFTACLALATLLESAYSARIAQELVYHTWWFTLLLALLALNVLCAALKKYPWKRHQSGFLITHAGLLVLVGGGLLTSLGGTEGQMLLVDTEDRAVQQRFHLPHQTDTIQLADRQQLEVYRVPSRPNPDHPALRAMMRVLDDGVDVPPELLSDLAGHYWLVDFTPGDLPWHADEHLRAALPWGLRALQFLADPWPGFTHDLDGQGTLTVHNYYPHTETWPFRKVSAGQDRCAALRLKLSTPMMPRPLDRWVSSLPTFERDPSPVSLEMMVLSEPALLNEFLHPPAPAQMGQRGQLVLAVGRRKKVCRVSLDTLTSDRPVDLAGTGLKLTFKKCADLMDLLGHHEAGARQGAPAYPAVLFELTDAGGRRGEYLACARLPEMPALRGGDDVAPVAAWYHVADFRWGDPTKMGSVQFLRGPDDALYYRVYGKDGLREPGREVDVSDPDKAVALPWKPMAMRFQVLLYLPHADRRQTVVPRDIRPGADPAERLEPALRCHLAADGKEQEFWVRLSRRAVPVRVGQALFFIRYRMASSRTDFALTLKKAQQINHPGTDRPASYQSDVVLSTQENGRTETSEHQISMNCTLDHGGCKVYQTSYRPLTDPQTFTPLLDQQGKLVSVSGLTVAHDPGLPFKYAGSGLLVLGIATMFFMRAYFFKPRRPAAAA